MLVEVKREAYIDEKLRSTAFWFFLSQTRDEYCSSLTPRISHFLIKNLFFFSSIFHIFFFILLSFLFSFVVVACFFFQCNEYFLVWVVINIKQFCSMGFYFNVFFCFILFEMKPSKNDSMHKKW